MGTPPLQPANWPCTLVKPSEMQLCTIEAELHMFHVDWRTGLLALHLTYLHMHLNMFDAFYTLLLTSSRQCAQPNEGIM